MIRRSHGAPLALSILLLAPARAATQNVLPERTSSSPVLDPMQLSSDRLLLRPFEEREATELLAVFRDPSVRRYLLDDMLVSPEWVRAEIASSAVRFAQSGAGLWTIRLREQGPIVGFVGFREFFDPPRLQLLYGLLPSYWGRGLATEAAERVCRHAFSELGFERIEAATDLPNASSIAVLERLGMELTAHTDDGPSGTLFYEIVRPR